MVMEFGMSRLGRVNYRERARSTYLPGIEDVRDRGHSEQTAREIDLEIKRIIEESLEKVRHILQTRRKALVALAERLIEKEVDRQRGAEADHRGQLAQRDDRARHGRSRPAPGRRGTEPPRARRRRRKDEERKKGFDPVSRPAPCLRCGCKCHVALRRRTGTLRQCRTSQAVAPRNRSPSKRCP